MDVINQYYKIVDIKPVYKRVHLPAHTSSPLSIQNQSRAVELFYNNNLGVWSPKNSNNSDSGKSQKSKFKKKGSYETENITVVDINFN